MVRLGAQSLLFATDAARRRGRPTASFSITGRVFRGGLLGFRENLNLVDALIPETERGAHADSFLQNAYQLFSETIYESAGPGETPELVSTLPIPTPHTRRFPSGGTAFFKGSILSRTRAK